MVSRRGQNSPQFLKNVYISDLPSITSRKFIYADRLALATQNNLIKDHRKHAYGGPTFII